MERWKDKVVEEPVRRSEDAFRASLEEQGRRRGSMTTMKTCAEPGVREEARRKGSKLLKEELG